VPITENDRSLIYTLDELENELRQAEIITGLIQYEYDPVSEDTSSIPHTFAVVASQDCDLLRDYENRSEGKAPALNGVLIYEAQSASVSKAAIPAGSSWSKITQNSDSRFHFFEKIPDYSDLAGAGLPALVVDFRKFFCIPSSEILRQCATQGNAKRRCRLHMPYREHFQSRLCHYMQRVMLPKAHDPTILD